MSSERPVVLDVRGVAKKYRMVAPGTELKTTLLRPFAAWRSRRQRANLWAVSDVSFQVPRGEFFSIIGANGSGKSTLLRLLAGLSKPTRGSIRVEGTISTLLELGSGFHPQVSGRENAVMNGLLVGMTRAEIEALLPRIIEFAGLQEFIDQPMRTYSSGMYVRLGFAIAAFLEPELLLVDEVLAVGDLRFQEKCYEHIAGLQRQGVTIVMVSHDLAAVQRFSDRAALMERGHIVAIGDPKKVVSLHVERLASSSPEIRAALEEHIAADQEGMDRLLAEDPEARAAFAAALELNPEFRRRMDEEAARQHGE
ncbi:MAG TPA: ABC transporter ATP-binding protein [Tepidiformaceae bacterium]|nr:ABC transporter ATP-binding protein [Tepidiformaceae bacterium]HNO64956.1 ABC transporter ATP-binding protein [Tepidiformaceae bacterium]